MTEPGGGEPPALPIRHPFDGHDYAWMGDGTVMVTNRETREESLYRVDGQRLSGDFKSADPMMLMFARDIARPQEALAPGVRVIVSS